MAWYNTYRPQRFSDVVGQDLVKTVLENALAKNRIKHAYLFSGPKGVGKTTLARIFANHLLEIEKNPEAKIDLVEMDAASNTSIDDVRMLIESAKTPPLHSQFKIYIIDEVHMLSKPAMNALLKILEEPPSYLVFLLATTNPEKLLPTVLSRLTKLTLSGHTVEDIVTRLSHIAKQEQVTIDQKSLELIAKRSGGSQRDAINLLETVASYELDTYTLKETTELLGLLPDELLKQTATELLSTSSPFPSETLEKLQNTGVDGESFAAQLLEYLLDQSFAGIDTYDALILPLAEVLDLRLPVASIPSMIALILVKIRNQQIPATPQIKPMQASKKNFESLAEPVLKPDVTIIHEETISKPISEPVNSPTNKPEAKADSNTPHQSEIIRDDKQEEAQPKPNLNKSSHETTKEEQSSSTHETLSRILSSSSTPPMIKMMAQDLALEEEKSDSVVLSVSSGIFHGQLNSPKIRSWIEEELGLQLGRKISVQSIIRTQENTATKPLINKEVAQPQLTTKPTVVSESPKKQSSNPKHDQEIFYTVYRELPPNSDSSKIDVFPAPIPKPTERYDWDQHTDELFEFEE